MSSDPAEATLKPPRVIASAPVVAIHVFVLIITILQLHIALLVRAIEGFAPSLVVLATLSIRAHALLVLRIAGVLAALVW